MTINLKVKHNSGTIRPVEKETPYLEFPMFAETGLVRHGFSTRLGGVSTGDYTSLNLSFSRGDEAAAVQENFRRITRAIGVQCEDLVFSQQTHTTNVRIVTEEDRGSGMTRPLEYSDVDGLVTNVRGLCLVTFYADCVPLYFLDPVRQVIGLSHSGWRGTVGKIGQKTVELMHREYGCDPGDILGAIGPSICGACYEVSEDVIDVFRENFREKDWPVLFRQKKNGKYQLDLWKANEIIFGEAGIRPEHIAVTEVCTHCNSDILYSHRTTGDRRGNLAAFLALK